MNKNLYTILVPCNYNDGTPVRTRHHREWDKRVRRVIGGLTILPPGKGQWIDNGILYEDRVIPVNLMATEAEMEVIAGITVKHYDQEAVMFFLVSDFVVVYRNPDKVTV